MGIPKKGSRKITVNGHAFRWLRPKKDRLYGDAPQVIRLVIQEDVESPGQPLILDLVTIRPKDEDWDVHRATLLPRDIEKIILEARSQGWNPSSRGALFKIKGPLELSDYRLIKGIP